MIFSPKLVPGATPLLARMFGCRTSRRLVTTRACPTDYFMNEPRRGGVGSGNEI